MFFQCWEAALRSGTTHRQNGCNFFVILKKKKLQFWYQCVPSNYSEICTRRNMSATNQQLRIKFCLNVKQFPQLIKKHSAWNGFCKKSCNSIKKHDIPCPKALKCHKIDGKTLLFRFPFWLYKHLKIAVWSSAGARNPKTKCLECYALWTSSCCVEIAKRNTCGWLRNFLQPA